MLLSPILLVLFFGAASALVDDVGKVFLNSKGFNSLVFTSPGGLFYEHWGYWAVGQSVDAVRVAVGATHAQCWDQVPTYSERNTGRGRMGGGYEVDLLCLFVHAGVSYAVIVEVDEKHHGFWKGEKGGLSITLCFFFARPAPPFSHRRISSLQTSFLPSSPQKKDIFRSLLVAFFTYFAHFLLQGVLVKPSKGGVMLRIMYTVYTPLLRKFLEHAKEGQVALNLAGYEVDSNHSHAPGSTAAKWAVVVCALVHLKLLATGSPEVGVYFRKKSLRGVPKQPQDLSDSQGLALRYMWYGWAGNTLMGRAATQLVYRGLLEGLRAAMGKALAGVVVAGQVGGPPANHIVSLTGSPHECIWTTSLKEKTVSSSLGASRPGVSHFHLGSPAGKDLLGDAPTVSHLSPIPPSFLASRPDLRALPTGVFLFFFRFQNTDARVKIHKLLNWFPPSGMTPLPPGTLAGLEIHQGGNKVWSPAMGAGGGINEKEEDIEEVDDPVVRGFYYKDEDPIEEDYLTDLEMPFEYSDYLTRMMSGWKTHAGDGLVLNVDTETYEAPALPPGASQEDLDYVQLCLDFDACMGISGELLGCGH